MAMNGIESARLANRAAALSFAAAFAVILALVTFSKVLDDGSSWAARLAAGVPVIAAVLLLALATQARMRWSAHGRLLRPSAAPHDPLGASEPNTTSTVAPRTDERRRGARSRAKRSKDALPRPVKPGPSSSTSDTSGSLPR